MNSPEAPTLTLREKRQAAARARWGGPRIVRLDDLLPNQKALVLALVAAAKATNETPAR